jgi:hypothetical protein
MRRASGGEGSGSNRISCAPLVRFVTALALGFLLSCVAMAQSSPELALEPAGLPSATPSATLAEAQPKALSAGPSELLPIIPTPAPPVNILTASIYPGEPGFIPLSGDQRSSLFFKGYLGAPATYLLPLVEGGASQMANMPVGWPSNMNGYDRRVGTSLALNTMEAGIRDAGDAAMGLDPRYFPCRCTGSLRRSWYALKMTALAYNSSGHARLDLPRIAGDYASSMLITTWYPSQYSPLVQGVKTGHMQLGTDLAFNLYREFTPEMKRVLHIFRKP